MTEIYKSLPSDAMTTSVKGMQERERTILSAELLSVLREEK